MDRGRNDVHGRVRATEEKDVGGGQRLRIYEPVNPLHTALPPSKTPTSASLSHGANSRPEIAGFGQPLPRSAAPGTYAPNYQSVGTSLEQASAASVPGCPLTIASAKPPPSPASTATAQGRHRLSSGVAQRGTGHAPVRWEDGEGVRVLSREDARRKAQEAKRAGMGEARVGGKEGRKGGEGGYAVGGDARVDGPQTPRQQTGQMYAPSPARAKTQPTQRQAKPSRGARADMMPPPSLPVRTRTVHTPVRANVQPQAQPRYVLDPNTLGSGPRATSPAPSVFLTSAAADHEHDMAAHDRDRPPEAGNASAVSSPLIECWPEETMQDAPAQVNFQPKYELAYDTSGHLQEHAQDPEPAWKRHLDNMRPEFAQEVITGVQEETQIEMSGIIYTLQDSLKDANAQLAAKQSEAAAAQAALEALKAKEEVFDQTSSRIKASDVALQAVQSTHDQEKAASMAVVDEYKAQLNEYIAERNKIILDLVGPPNEGERPASLAEAILGFKQKNITTLRQARDAARDAQNEFEPIKAAHKAEIDAATAKVKELREKRDEQMQKCQSLQAKLNNKEKEVLEKVDHQRKIERAHAVALTQKETELAEAAIRILEGEKQVTAAEARLKTHEEELADLEDVVSQLEQEKEELAEELESKTADFERLVANFEEARSEVATLKVPSTLPVAQAKGRWQGDLDAAGRELEKLRREKVTLESSLKEAQANLDRFTADAKATEEKLEGDLELLQQKLTSAEATSKEAGSAARGKIAELEDALKKCKGDLENSKEEQAALQKQLDERPDTAKVTQTENDLTPQVGSSTAEERIAAMTLELREAEKKLELSTALEALGKILDAPGHVRKGLNIQEHQLLRNAHDHLKQQLLLKEREARQLKDRVKELDPEAYESEIKQLKDTLKEIQSTGAAAGLQERWEEDRLTEVEAAVFAMQAKRLKADHTDQLAPIAWKEKADTLENLFHRINSQKPTTPAEITAALRKFDRERATGNVDTSAHPSSTTIKPSASRTAANVTAGLTSKSKLASGSATTRQRPATTQVATTTPRSTASRSKDKAPESFSSLSELSDEDVGAADKGKRKADDADELDESEPEQPVKRVAKPARSALISAAQSAPKASILRPTTPTAARTKTPKTVNFRSPLLSQRSAHDDVSAAPSQQDGEEGTISMGEVDASIPSQEKKQATFFQRSKKRRLSDLNADDEVNDANDDNADDYATLFGPATETAPPKAPTGATRKTPAPSKSKARKVEKESSLNSIALTRPRRAGSVASYAPTPEPEASFEMPVATQKYGRVRNA